MIVPFVSHKIHTHITKVIIRIKYQILKTPEKKGINKWVRKP